jgi:gliding motility-associated lipoprotein GldH
VKTLALSLAVTGLLLAGCGGNVVFQQDQEVPGGTWARSWKPAFTIPVTDTVTPCNIFLDLRHNGDYRFSNLYLFATLDGPGGRIFTDTVECTLADPTGRWYGKGTGFIFSDRFQAHVLYRMNNRFPRAGRYVMTLEQAMRTEELPGMLDVGISVERATAKQ